MNNKRAHLAELYSYIKQYLNFKNNKTNFAVAGDGKNLAAHEQDEPRLKNMNYDMSRLSTDSGWSKLYEDLEQTIPLWLSSLTKKELSIQINRFGKSGYIEKIWLEDLADNQ